MKDIIRTIILIAIIVLLLYWSESRWKSIQKEVYAEGYKACIVDFKVLEGDHAIK